MGKVKEGKEPTCLNMRVPSYYQVQSCISNCGESEAIVKSV